MCSDAEERSQEAFDSHFTAIKHRRDRLCAMMLAAFRSSDHLEEAHRLASHAITVSSITTDDVRITIEQKDGKVPDIGGNPGMFQVECHASSARIMKSIHGMNRPTSYLV